MSQFYCAADGSSRVSEDEDMSAQFFTIAVAPNSGALAEADEASFERKTQHRCPLPPTLQGREGGGSTAVVVPLTRLRAGYK